MKAIIGKGCNLEDVFMDSWAQITIGDYVFFGYQCMLLTGSHDYSKRGQERKITGNHKPITIKNGVWIASRAIVLGGVTIGENAVIGAGSVVTHDIPANVFAAGVPAKVIKKI